MISLPENLYVRCRNEFLGCDVFASDNDLRIVFEIAELRPFRDSLPEAHSPIDRVNKTISFLLRKGRHKEQAVLVTFIQVITGFIDKEDERHSRLEKLLKEVEEAIYLPIESVYAVDEKDGSGLSADSGSEPVSSEKDMVPTITDKQNIPEMVTKQHGDILLINKYYTDIVTELKNVRDARKLFGDMQKVIYPDKMWSLNDSLNLMRELVQKFSHVVDTTTHLPLVSNPFRVSLAEVLHHLDALLRKVILANLSFRASRMNIYGDRTIQRQNVYQTLNELIKSFDNMRKLMKSLNKAGLPSESNS